MYTGGSKYRIIVRAESVEVFRIYFGSAVAAHQVIFKKDTYFRYDRPSAGMTGGGYFNTRQQVFLTVGTKHTDGKL